MAQPTGASSSGAAEENEDSTGFLPSFDNIDTFVQVIKTLSFKIICNIASESPHYPGMNRKTYSTCDHRAIIPVIYH